MAPKKILVIEDQVINRQLLSQILAEQYVVLEAGNGQEGLDILRRHGEDISLIMLDLMMPVMDGYTFLSVVKSIPAYSAIPIIVTTEQDEESDELAALSHGATDFVVKPYKPQIILHRVASLVTLSSLQKTAAMVNLFQYDRLTGLFSKEYFNEKVRETLAKNPDKRYDLICSDIENFKLINDIYGVPSADRLLCAIADLFNKRTSIWGVCCRLNADQFACMIEHRIEYTDELFSHLLAEINAHTEVKNIVIKWGVYPINNDDASVEQMLDRALLAAQSIKGQYGTYFAIYDDNLRRQMLHVQAITDSMESALAEKQFEIYLQPKYRIHDGALIGAEALVRWHHPEWGYQSPADFIPLFEKNGFITKLDQYVWDLVCEVLKKWDQRGFPSFPISVNVSRADIYHEDIAELLLDAVRRHGLTPQRLHLEITESAYTESTGQIIETVARLRKLGFKIEMDDFGSGYSSLNMLSKLPVDILKLDMKFLHSEIDLPAHKGVMQFIINLARMLKLVVIAEGVETEEQLSRLREIDCDCVQGYYFARPMPVEAFENLITQATENEHLREQ